jgi:hypothetical protein
LNYANYSSKINQPNIEYEKKQHELDLNFKKRYNNATMSEKQLLFDSIYEEKLFYLDTLLLIKRYNCSLKDSINIEVKDALFRIIKSNQELYGVNSQLLNKMKKEKELNLSVHFSANCSKDVNISLISIYSNNIQLDLTIFIELLDRKLYISKATIEAHPILYKPFPELTAIQSMKLSNLYFISSIVENPYWENFFKNKKPLKIGQNLKGLNKNIFKYKCYFKDDHPITELKPYHW